MGPTELIVIALIILLLFGGKKLPELFRGLGEGVREFKRGTEEALHPSEPETPEPAADEKTTSD